MSDNPERVRGKNVVAVIDFHEAVIYPTDAAPRQRPERLVATDPEGHFHEVHHHAGNPSGAYEDDSPAYWRDLTDALSPAEPFCSWGTERERPTRPTAGSPMSNSITRTSRPKRWLTFASTLTTSR